MPATTQNKASQRMDMVQTQHNPELFSMGTLDTSQEQIINHPDNQIVLSPESQDFMNKQRTKSAYSVNAATAMARAQ